MAANPSALLARAYEPWVGDREALDLVFALAGALAAALLLLGLRRCCGCYADVEKTPLLPTSALRSDQRRGRKGKRGTSRAGGTLCGV